MSSNSRHDWKWLDENGKRGLTDCSNRSMQKGREGVDVSRKIVISLMVWLAYFFWNLFIFSIAFSSPPSTLSSHVFQHVIITPSNLAKVWGFFPIWFAAIIWILKILRICRSFLSLWWRRQRPRMTWWYFSWGSFCFYIKEAKVAARQKHSIKFAYIPRLKELLYIYSYI